MKILALSSSRVGNSSYLEPAIPFVKELLGNTPLKVAFVPFATVNSYDDYYQKVTEAFKDLPYKIDMVDNTNCKILLQKCDAVMIGGGNTFKLLHDLYANDLVDLIRRKVLEGAPYVGWSAGSNILGLTINTTNDMPIIQPQSFEALALFPFQINPHYFNQIIPGFNGETRDQRLQEFLALNPTSTIFALPEGSALVCRGNTIVYYGAENGFRLYFDGSVKKDVLKHKQGLSI